MNNKIFLTIVGVILTVMAISQVKTSDETKETFVSGLTTRASPVVQTTQGLESLPTTSSRLLGNLSSNDFIQRPSFQSMLSPRFDANNYGAFIRYDTPDTKYLAAPPSNPLDYARMADDNVVENYNSHNSPQSCVDTVGEDIQLPQPPLAAGYAAGDYNKVLSDVYKNDSVDEHSDIMLEEPLLPVGDMKSVNAEGVEIMPVVYNNLMFTNRKSRLAAQGDFIRGDLPIQNCNTGWFNVAPRPSVDLQVGAMNVMGGVNVDSTSHKTAQLVYADSGRTDTTLGGVDMSSHFDVGVSNVLGGETVNATAFP